MTRATTGTNTQVFIATPAAPDVFVLVEELSDVQVIRGFDALEVTNFQSDEDKEHIKGLRNPGRYTMRGNWITNAPGQVVLRQAFEDKRPYGFMIGLPPNPGDAVGETWYFKALVLSSDPVRIAPGAKLEFESLLQATGKRTPGPVYANAFGSVGVTRSRPLYNTMYGARWENFTVRGFLPAGVAIQGIYPVVVASATHDGAYSYLKYGAGLSISDPVPGTGFSLPSDPTNTTYSITEWYGPSIGTDLSALTGQQILALLNATLDIDVVADVINVFSVGFAVYYLNSAPPAGVPQIPPPFAVPAGQAVAWALPATSTQLGVQPGGGGIFDPGTGYGLATPAVLDQTQNA
jgi:hypothetical protein